MNVKGRKEGREGRKERERGNKKKLRKGEGEEEEEGRYRVLSHLIEANLKNVNFFLRRGERFRGGKGGGGRGRGGEGKEKRPKGGEMTLAEERPHVEVDLVKDLHVLMGIYEEWKDGGEEGGEEE